MPAWQLKCIVPQSPGCTYVKKKRIGDVLLESGKIGEADLNRALATQQEKNLRLGEALLQSVRISKDDVAAAIEQVQGFEFVECPPRKIEASTLALIPRAVAVRCCALPLEIRDGSLLVAMADPQNLTLQDELKFCGGMAIFPRFSFREDILAGIQKFYDDEEPPTSAAESKTSDGKKRPKEQLDVTLAASGLSLADLEFISASTREENREALKELQAGMHQRTLAVRFVSMILAKAAERSASDVHIEPRVGNAVVRLRIDGILRELLSLPSAHQASVISRIKILADMDITERRLPQDGRFLLVYRGQRLDVRVSTLPTHLGEKIVMRILDPRSTLITFEQLGFSELQADTVKRLLLNPQGMVIVTGPTGSGKSTTLYAALNLVHSPERNIITVEDPVEYMLDGVNQVQIHPEAGLTFATCLPSILRQDPDIIMVGEIRDAETAEIALRASQTGHLVLSTLHTNDSVSAITRLMDLGVPRYLIGALNGVISQRLVRKLCGCRKVAPASRAYQESLAALGLQQRPDEMYQPVGCAVCENSGYKGRVGVYEILPIDKLVRDAVQADAHPEELRTLVRNCGLLTMQDDAVEKVRVGKTTLEEVRRVLPTYSTSSSRCSDCGREFLSSFQHCPFCGFPLIGPDSEQSEILSS